MCANMEREDGMVIEENLRFVLNESALLCKRL